MPEKSPESRVQGPESGNAPSLGAGEILKGLHAHERKVLETLSGKSSLPEAELFAATGLDAAQTRSAAERLKLKGALSITEDVREVSVHLTPEGAAVVFEQGLPEERLRAHLKKNPGTTLPDLKEAVPLPPDQFGTAYGNVKPFLESTPDKTLTWKGGPGEDRPERVNQLIRRMKEAGGAIPIGEIPEDLLPEIDKRSRKRGGGGWFKHQSTALRRLGLTDLGREVARAAHERGGVPDEVATLTPEMLRTGAWKTARLRPYDLNLAPHRPAFGRAHPYRAFLDWVKGRLVGLGFEEMTGDLVEPEFWNADALFMPQFHPARDIHDVYFVKSPEKVSVIEEPFLSQVAEAHRTGGGSGSRGWRYAFDMERTKRMVLRSQGTALSARWLARGAKVPGKYFAIARCFRSDTADATHAPDFFQVEGIVLGRKIHFRHLLGLLELFAREIARSPEVRFAPGYYPYTEPSVEVHIRHPKIGWMELGGAGIFRPELTHALGVNAPVIAWGLGLDRMAMVALGISDIRDLFTADLEFLRQRKATFL